MRKVQIGSLFTLRTAATRWLCCAALLMLAPLAQAGLLDGLFGKDSAQAGTSKPGASQRQWRIRDFMTVELVPRETGAPGNQHPAQVSPDALRQQLVQVQSVVGAGNQPLFSAEELTDLIEPLVQALGRAGGSDDVLLLSASRREAGSLSAPTAITARLFVHDDKLQLIVHEARHDFFDAYRGSNTVPRFTFGSRDAAGVARLHSSHATNRRPDWLSIPLRLPVALVAPAAATVPAAALPGAVAPAVAGAPARPVDSADPNQIEQRLETLKRLREKGLVSEDEYQQKRREILRQL